VNTEALKRAIEALEEIALAGMSGSGQESEDGMRAWHARRAWEFIGIAARALDPLRAALTQATASEGEPVECSPEFTDTARAALLWVLWHHQGGSSPVGQPLRYALGMGAHDHLNATQVSEAKRWAAITGSQTNEFHTAQPAPALMASSACPICGIDAPHTHTKIEVFAYLKAQAWRFLASEVHIEIGSEQQVLRRMLDENAQRNRQEADHEESRKKMCDAYAHGCENPHDRAVPVDQPAPAKAVIAASWEPTTQEEWTEHNWPYADHGSTVASWGGDGEIYKFTLPKIGEPAPAKALDDKAEYEKAAKDALLYGQGIQVDGKHVELERVRLHYPKDPAPAVPAGWSFEYGSLDSIIVKTPEGECIVLFKDATIGIDRLAYQMAALLSAAPAAVPAVPEGWEAKQDAGGWCYFKRPDGFCQAVTPHEAEQSHAQTLHALLSALLASAPTSTKGGV
jgi:hypothetical protein